MAARPYVMCDTNILIRLFHGDLAIREELDEIGFGRLAISSITAAEIYFGMRKGEVRKTKELLRRFHLIHLTEEVSRRCLALLSDRQRTRLQLPDALIAATAQTIPCELFTLNRRDFRDIPGLSLYRPSRKFG